MKRIPVVPTLVVAIAVAAMLALGIWQLQRRMWKEGLIARYTAAQAMNADVAWPREPAQVEPALFRHSRLYCDRVVRRGASAGRSARGEPGWAHTARCALDGGGEAEIALGWSRSPATVSWAGGEVFGIVAPGAGGEPRLVASRPAGGLQPLAAPDPRAIPNNHFAYAVQWFLFAAIAAAVYGLALRRRLRP